MARVMSVVQIKSQKHNTNPLDIFEDLLEASQHSFERQNRYRLSFDCSGKRGDYNIVLEWNEDMRALRIHVVVPQTQNRDQQVLLEHIEKANEGLWKGYFAVDGVGNTIFKNVIELASYGDSAIIQDIETLMDNSLEEVDRLWVILGLSDKKSDDLFAETHWDVENLSLLLSDPKGSA
jgi:hypothetical protein